jgi:hypothetical protein
MTQIQSSDYDAYAYTWLTFDCRDCKSVIEPPDWDGDFNDKYFKYAARKAESDGWYIGFDSNFTCLCPVCRKKKRV